MDNAHFPIWADESMLTVGARSRTNSLLRCPKYSLTIVGVEHFAHCRYIHRGFLRSQSKDSGCFLRPDNAIRIEIPNPVAKVGYALGFLQPSSAFLQVSGQGMPGGLGALQFCDVLNGTEQPVGFSGFPFARISRQRAPKL